MHTRGDLANLETAHAVPGLEVAERLGSDVTRGLSEREATRRRRVFGPNMVAGGTRPSRIALIGRQFASPLVWVLAAAVLVSGFLLGQWVDAGVIGAIVFLNAALGYLQEARAEGALAGVQKLTAPRAVVVRDGAEREVFAVDVVPSDIVVLEAGSRVPADGRVLCAEDLRVNESALTGESFPVRKAVSPLPADTPLAERRAMVFMGTGVEKGRGRAVVTSTGVATAMGDIALLITEQQERSTPLQRELDRLGRHLSALALLTAILIFAVGVARGLPTERIFLIAVALAVAAIPEGLPTAVTIILARGVQTMASRAAVVRHLPAVEALGSASVICTDKTGTLTRNEIRVAQLAYAGHVVPLDAAVASDHIVRRYAQVAALCNDARSASDGGTDGYVGDATETALLASLDTLGANADTLRASYPRIAEAPFDPDRKRMSTLHRDPAGGLLLAVKGAPEVIAERLAAIETSGGPCDADEAHRAWIRRAAEQLSEAGLRTLALAYRQLPPTDDVDPAEQENDLVFVAVVGMHDDLRSEAAAAVRRAQRAGIRVVLVTGDHAQTGATVARQVGILRGGQLVAEGQQLHGWTEQELERTVERCAVFARVEPRDKVKIVQAWQGRGGVVAMTGDGVNDAAALRAADIGVAMGSGTAVAKDAADVVLTDDNFATIVAAVREGRRVFDNVKKSVYFLLAGNLSEVFVIALAVLAFGRFGEPLLPTQILWINLVTDGLPVLALAADAAAAGVMTRPPLPVRRLLGLAEQTRLLAQGAVLAAPLAALLYAGFLRGVAWQHVQTVVFATLAFVQFLHAFNVRSVGLVHWWDGFTGNRWLLASVAASAVLQVAVIETPVGQRLVGTTSLPAADWAAVVVLTALSFAAVHGLRRLVGSVDPTGRARPPSGSASA